MPESSVTLYQAEDYLSAMLDTEDGGVPAEMEEQFALELRNAVGAAVDKREKVGQFILHCEAQAEFARKEAQRITKRARVFENVAERVRNYVRDWILQQPRDAKGKLPKLQGHTLAMSTRACPASLEITDEGEVPLRFKTVTVTMSVEDWQTVVAMMNDQDDSKWLSQPPASYSVNRAAIKKSIEGGAEVPGADLVTGNVTLQVK